ncbi:MAG: tRNA (N6-isopentenyl adenosine(37)-C2)-methylthiotransferase MiaB [Candidatus Uhrbacteria bacterium]
MKYHLITFGCQMNHSDAERVATILQGLGFLPTENRAAADFILITTCSVRQTAEDRVYGLLRELNKLKKKNPRLLIGVTGCMAGRDTDGKIKRRLRGVDLFFPTSDMIRLPEMLAEKWLDVQFNFSCDDDYLLIKPQYHLKHKAFVTIQTGCNKFCSYCVVPYARGREKNRLAADVLTEIKSLAANGCLEVTLLGQAVNTYRAADPESFSAANPYKDHFAALLWEIDKILGIKRIHYTAPYPNHMTDEVIDALTLPAQVNFLHLPVQSGDNEILRRMNRRYTSEEYLEIVKKIKTCCPNIALGTDIIVGFCGETEEQFERTLDLYRQCDFDISYHAQYSSRSGTLAAKAFKDDVTKEEKERRWRKIQTLMEESTLRKNQKFAGQTVEVLVDRCDEKGKCWGNTREMKVACFSGSSDLIGTIVKMKVERPDVWALFGSKAE